MAYCKKCGEDIGDSSFCPVCGEKNEGGAQTSQNSQNAYEQNGFAQPEIVPAYEDAFEKDVAENKGYAVLSYIGFLCLIPLFAAPKTSAYVRLHLSQGLTIFAAEIILSILSAIPIVNFVAGLLDIALLVFSIWGIVNAAKGTMNKLPLVEKLDLISLFGLGWR